MVRAWITTFLFSFAAAALLICAVSIMSPLVWVPAFVGTLMATAITVAYKA